MRNPISHTIKLKNIGKFHLVHYLIPRERGRRYRHLNDYYVKLLQLALKYKYLKRYLWKTENELNKYYEIGIEDIQRHTDGTTFE